MECRDVDDGADFVVQLCGNALVTFELEGRCAGDEYAKLELGSFAFISFLYHVSVLSAIARILPCADAIWLGW